MRSAIAIFVGFVIWLASCFSQLIVILIMWDLTPESYISIASIAILGTMIGLMLAAMAISRICKQPCQKEICLVAICAVLWIGSSLGSGVHFDYRLISFLGTILAAVTVLVTLKRNNWFIK